MPRNDTTYQRQHTTLFHASLFRRGFRQPVLTIRRYRHADVSGLLCALRFAGRLFDNAAYWLSRLD